MNRLLVAGVAAIVAVGLAPLALDAWRERELRIEQEKQQRIIEQKEREIACYEALRSGGLRPGMDVKAEIDRCRRESVRDGG